MTIFPLRPGLSPREVGHKFANLGNVAHLVTVPPSVCIPVRWQQVAMGTGIRASLDRIASQLTATKAFDLMAALNELDLTVATVRVPGELADVLNTKLKQWNDAPVAIRSSAATEDSAQASYAGVYDTSTGVRGIEDVCAAIERCWRSYYGPRAITARLRHGEDVATPAMAVIMQPMVDAVLAGVTIIEADGEVVTEFVRGAGESLVSGSVAGIHASSLETSHISGDDAMIVARVVKVAHSLRARINRPIDVEWIWDGRAVLVVQVRPIVARASAAKTAAFAMAALYENPLPSNIELGDCRSIRDHFLVKRGWVRAAAERAGFATGAGWVINFTHAGLTRHGHELNELLAACKATQIVIDLGPSVRQVVIAKDEVVTHLLYVTPRDHTVHVALLREFYTGVGGAICTLQGQSDQFIIEYCEAGLLALNRGIAGADTYVLDAQGALGTPVNLAQANAALARAWRQMLKLNRELDNYVPGIQLEWVIERDRLVFIDYSVPSRASVTGRLENLSMVISPGHASGRALVVDDFFLGELSIGATVSISDAANIEHYAIINLIEMVQQAAEPPILVATRPYAALSVVMDLVAGYVFRHSSLLSHLALLLRERRCPAVSSQLHISTGDHVSFSNGLIRVDPGRSRTETTSQ